MIRIMQIYLGSTCTINLKPFIGSWLVKAFPHVSVPLDIHDDQDEHFLEYPY